MERDGTLIALNDETHPNCYLHRSNPSDVARVEHLTFVCTKNKDDAGPNNNWMEPAEAHAKVDALFDGAMRGRTMYVIPYCMGPIDSPIARCGVEITDSPYVVANMRIMTRMGAPALARIEREGNVRQGPAFDRRARSGTALHHAFPGRAHRSKSIGSGYGGNALLGKKCHALRIASWQARDEGWLAEHMLIVGIENPRRRDALRRRGVSVRLRQDQSRDADPAGELSQGRLESLDRRRRHLLDDARRRRPPVGDQSRSRLFRRRARHQHDDESERARDDADATRSSPTSRSPRTTSPGGKACPATPVTDWQGRPHDATNGPAAHPNSRFTVAGEAMPELVAARGRRAGRADLRDHLRRTPPVARAARVRSARLEARRAGRRIDGLGNDRGRDRRRSACCAATRWR